MNDLDKLLPKFNRNLGASSNAIQAAASVLKIDFPDDYVAFLSASNGGEGMIGETYLMLWPVEELNEMNTSYQVDEFAPGLLLFGSNGGGEAFAFDTRTKPFKVVQVPFVGMDLDDVEVLAPSFDAFLRVLIDE